MDTMTKPSNLLDLPLDLVKNILKEVTHTNDLSALALTCSTIHELVSPLIYSRFDIVWPDGATQTEPRTGVDALTYGLATLVMREDLFARNRARAEGSGLYPGQASSQDAHIHRGVRRGNNYSHHIKKFSLGNGPPDLVQEYVITKDAGKLLGTMAALALARMTNLESFVWDMPTGIVRDVWINLSEPSRLDRIFIRFHDNRKAYQESGLVRASGSRRPPASQHSIPQGLHSSSHSDDPGAAALSTKFVHANYHVESPNFSILPPLCAIGAVNIDELANLNELSLLVAKSAGKLRELRVGISDHLLSSGLPPNSRAIQYLDPRNGTKGTLDLLFSGLPQCKPSGRFSDHPVTGQRLFEPFIASTLSEDIVDTGEVQVMAELSTLPLATTSALAPIVNGAPIAGGQLVEKIGDEGAIDPALKSHASVTSDDQRSPAPARGLTSSDAFIPAHCNAERSPPYKKEHAYIDLALRTQPRLSQKLSLTHLELERQHLNVGLLEKAIEFPTLEHLTLLKCINTDEVWQSLKDWYAPTKSSTPIATTSPRPFETDATGSQTRLRRTPTSFKPFSTPAYRLKLKKIHTDTVSPQLLVFLKETLAPNSLEWLFLQDNREYRSPVTINQIWKGPLRRHRGSLTKLLIDSSEKGRTRPLGAKKWMLHRDALSSIVSPDKAPKLRELSVSIQYKDFHWFLQQLPNIRTLRSLHIPVIADHVNGNHFNIRDVALNVVDVINLRRECELAYLAIGNKCFELAEVKVTKCGKKRGGTADSGQINIDEDDDSSADEYVAHGADHDDDDDDDDDDVSEDEDEADDDDAQNDTDAFVDGGADDADEEADSSDDENTSMRHQAQLTKVKLREILFFDDRVAIFKARHAKL